MNELCCPVDPKWQSWLVGIGLKGKYKAGLGSKHRPELRFGDDFHA